MRNHRTWTLAMAAALAAVTYVHAEQMDAGLVTALDRIGGNLLGTTAFNAVLSTPPEPVEPQRLRIYLSEAQSNPVEIIVLAQPPDPVLDPPEPVRAFFRMTVGGPDGTKFEYDPRTGEIIPCVEPPNDLSAFAARFDGVAKSGTWRAGLITALDEVGANLLGANTFRALLLEPPEPVAPQRLRLFFAKNSAVEFVLQAPPEPILPALRIVLGGDEIEIFQDARLAPTRLPLQIVDADLSALTSSR